MDRNFLQHPRNLVYNADASNSNTTQYNLYTNNVNNNELDVDENIDEEYHDEEYNDEEYNDDEYNDGEYHENEYPNNEYHNIYNTNQTTNSVSHNVYNNDQNLIDSSDHNIYRTDQNIVNTNTNRNVYNAGQAILNNAGQNILNTAEQRTGQNMEVYNNTFQNFIQKPNQDNYNNGNLNVDDSYYGDDEEQNMYSNIPDNLYNANENIYNTSEQKQLVWSPTSGSIENSMQNTLPTQWNSTSSSNQNSAQTSASNQNISIWNSSSNSIENPQQKYLPNVNNCNSILNSSQNTMSNQSVSPLPNVTTQTSAWKSPQNNPLKNMCADNFVNKITQPKKKADGCLSNKRNNNHGVPNTNVNKIDQVGIHSKKVINTNFTDKVSNHNTKETKHKFNKTQPSTAKNKAHTSGNNISRNAAKQSKGDIEKHRADMIIVLSLLQDMCTAIEYTEASLSVAQKHSSSMQNNGEFDDEEFDDEEFDDEEFDDEELNEEEEEFDDGELDDDGEYEANVENKESGSSNTGKFRFSLTKDNSIESEHSFEELSDGSDEVDCENKQKIPVIKNTSKGKRKKGNQRKNIRNVYADKKLDTKTQLLREKEQVRLQRLGLKQSIENTGKLLRASVKKTVVEKKPTPSVSTKKPSEVICLDSDSDEDDKCSKPAVKEPILVLSSDSDEGEDGAGPVFDELVQAEDYYSELGLHTNDTLNVCENNGRVLINVNHNKDDKDIFLHRFIGSNLKPHQIGGVRFLYDNLIESVAHFRPDEGNGCLLAHAMGLGKTIQTITFIDLFLRYTSAKKVLCVVPVNTIQNWMNEFNRWLPAKHDDFNICDFVPKMTVPKVSTPKSKKLKRTKKQGEDIGMIRDLLDDMVEFVVKKQVSNDVFDVVNEILDNVCKDTEETKPLVEPVEFDGFRTFHVFLIDAHKNLVERAKIIEEWDKCGGVLLAGYEMYRSIAMYKVVTKGKVKKDKKLTDVNGDVLLRLKKAVCKPGPDLVVCDEGHRIRNYQSGISQALKSIKTRKRLVLTGYPLQNNLIEYWCMVDFVRPNYLGSRQEFSNMFERPIMNGQCVDSTPKDKHLMKQRAHVLYSLLQGFVQRRGHDVFNNILPSKEEHVLMVRLSPIQKALYNRLIELTREAYNDSLNPVKTFSLCCKIWNHPDILYDAIRLSREGKKVDIISDQDDISLDDSTGKQKRKRKQPASFSPVPNGMVVGNIGFDPFGTEAKDLLTDILQWASPIFQDYPYQPGNILNSGKFFVLKNLLDESLACGDKMLVFSQSLLTLNAMELMLQRNYKHIDGTLWKKGRDYFRLDGGTNSLERERMINSFNEENNKHTHLFLLSTRAGCLGINLVAANRVVVFDVSWNPCHDAQAVCRIYRYGQTKQCHIYRLVSSNTMEKKIYYRQISKQGISDRVVDEVSLTENFSKNEIQSLVIEDWVNEPLQNFSISAYTFVDPVLVNVLLICNEWITQLPFEHESLLITEGSQKLSGSEKRAAKREYEQERMMAQGSHVPFRTYPLQQNFPRNMPIAPVRPFLWRPPLNQSTSWLQNPTNSLFQHTVSHNVTVPTSFPSTDPLQILRHGAYTGDHSYTGTEISTSNDSSNDYWSLDSQLSSIRSAFSTTNLSSVLNRNRSLLSILPNNGPLGRLTESATNHPITAAAAAVATTITSTTTASSLRSVTSSVSNEITTTTQVSTGTSCPLENSTETPIVHQSFSFLRAADEKSREDNTYTPDQSTDAFDTTLYHTEQSLNFEDSSDFYDSNSYDNSNDAFTNRDSQNTRNVEVIVLDDDEDD